MSSLRKTARHCAIAFGIGLLISAPTYAATFKTLASGLPNSLEISAVVGTTAYVLEGQLAAFMRGPNAPATPPPTKPFKATAVQVGKP